MENKVLDFYTSIESNRMICKFCFKENRASAKYCKWCGKMIVMEDNPLERIIGRDDVKQQLKTIVDTYSFIRSRKETQNIRLGANSVIIGETGTGKTLLAQAIRDCFFQNKIIEKNKLTVVDAVDYERFVEDWHKNIKEARGGILFFDNVQKLLPDTYSKSVNPLDKLFVEMSNWNEDPIVILAGLPGGLEDFFDKNPAARNRFKYFLRLPSFGFEEMTAICRDVLKNRYGLEEYTAEAEKKLLRFFKYKVKTKDDSFGNGHLACQMAEDIFTSFLSRGISNDNLQVLEDDIRGYVPKESTLDDILAEMNDFVGAEEVKRAVKEIAWEVQSNLQRVQRGLSSGQNVSMHLVLTGNPGTGKTTIARKLGEIFESIGFLDSGHVVEVDRSQMVSQYSGETPKLVDRLCDKAMGGILFIDEAYTLAPLKSSGEKDELGTQALEKLMKRMEDDRGKFVVIAAGYKTEMENLFRINPGMRSRFNRFLNIEDYNADELFRILEVFVEKKNYKLNEAAAVIAKQALTQMYDVRDKNFANGRAVREMFEKMCSRQAERIHAMDLSQLTNEELLTFHSEDIPYERPKTIDYKECLKEFNGLIGLSSVKNEISNLASYINLQVQRGDTSGLTGRHYVFSGNPGTGKTTVARIMAQVFQSLGMASRGQLIEADRSKLVASYTGQTAIKTNQLIDSAMGGVLFIDEAYTLITSEFDTFGKEAVDTLLKRMEDDRGKFICIVAGYPNEMQSFLETNPGLRSRFTEVITFEDYLPEELSQIFMNLAKERNFVMSLKTQDGVRRLFEKMYLQRTVNFGNAREVRKVFETAVSNQSKRLMQLMSNPMFSSDQMYELTLADIEGEESERVRPLDDILVELDEFVGMKSIKEAVRRLTVQSLFMKERAKMGVGTAENITVNIVLTGNPGTGKTTIARKLGQVLQSAGLLSSSKVIEVDRSQMVGKYMGETPKLVNSLCQRAMGGILFIDEAYTLSSDNDKYGKEAIETLMKRMEDDAGKFVVIAAGYQQEMEYFLNANPGLASRFTYKLNIEDYTAMELVEIFHKMVERKQYKLHPTAEMALIKKIMEMYQNRAQNFGNAREIRNLFSSTIQQLSIRVSELSEEERTSESFQLILPQDIV